jgi:hypothetical protein
LIKRKLYSAVLLVIALHICYAARCDIVFVLDKKAAFGNGHIAVMVGNETVGWRYISINGTPGMPMPWGANTNPDKGILITDTEGAAIGNLRHAIRRANSVNSEKKHHYLVFRRLCSSADEDSAVMATAVKTASEYLYGIAGPGQSCIDVAQVAFSTLVRLRVLDQNATIPGQSDLIPKNWFRKLVARVRIVNRASKNKQNAIRFHRKINKKEKVGLRKNE